MVQSTILAADRMEDIIRAGQLRLALFLPQYQRDAVSSELRGIGTGYLALEIARKLAERLAVGLAVVEYPTPAAALAALKAAACDIGFFGIEPSRVAEFDFTPAIFQFGYSYLVPADSAIASIAEADRPGIKIAFVRGHASALALARLVERAELIGATLPDEGFELLRGGDADVFALPRDHLLEYAAKLPGARVLAENYGVNRVGMAVRKGRAGLLGYLNEFVVEAKGSGFIAGAIERGGLRCFEMAV
jgi:polar amino acid transport system substrate-binding protein